MNKIMNITAEGKKMRTVSKFGKHEIVTDEPQNFGGEDTAANPLATLLASLAGCENATAQMIAKELSIKIESISFDISGEFDLLGLKGDPSVKPYFTSIDINVKVRTDADESTFNQLKEKVHARCPVYTLLNAANVELNSTWEKE